MKERRMSISAKSVRFDDDSLWADLEDGRTLSVPLANKPVDKKRN
jgi:hypothetical protein